MEKSKFWITIPIYWIAFVIYNIFLEPISSCFRFYDITKGSGKYHYGACSFSITISLVLLVLGIVYVMKGVAKDSYLKEDYYWKKARKRGMIVISILVLSFVVQFFYYLNHFSYYYLFGIVLW